MSVRINWNDHGLSVRMRNAPDGIKREMRRFVDTVTVTAEGNVVRNTPVGATSHLRQSITHDVNTSGIGINGRVYSSDVPVKVASVEEGRAPGRMPPRAPIEMWVRRKIGGDNVQGIAFLIARAIGRRGTKGAHMFAKGFDATRGRINSEVGALASRIGKLF